MIRFITDSTMKSAIARAVLEALTEWFEVEESREDYIAKAAGWPMFAAFADGADAKAAGKETKTAAGAGEAAKEGAGEDALKAEDAIGFLCLKSTGPETVELAVMGVLKEHHREGVGRRLFAAAKDYAVQQGFSFFQVKTVATGMYEDYDRTNYFYQSLGFKELEVFNEIWGEENPCQIYVMSLKSAIGTINTRHSYRGAFADEKVPRKDLEIIARAGIDAPSGCNKQTTDIVVVDDPEVLSKIKETIDPPVAQTAPAMIVVLTRRINAYRDRCFAVQDYSAAIENMLLAIVELGYQSCWYEGHITDEDRICDRIAEVLGVPEEYDVVCLLPVGKALDDFHAPKKRPFSERVKFNRF